MTNAELTLARAGRGRSRPALITGGAGFVGTNLAHRLLESGRSVLLFDNLSRAGVEQNLRWLRAVHGARVQIETGDVRDAAAVRRAVERASEVYHFAAQVAVTTSLDDPLHDFDVNARGTLNVLEAIRAQPTPPPLVFTSTNKVYGALDDLPLRRRNARYEPTDDQVRRHGVDETRPLDFHSPYGCSKGTADQYVLDYARSYGIPAIVFRMSCIYGPHQFGNEDQGWVAHFAIRALEGRPITLYGDGRQVRDILFVEDLVDAFLLAQSHMPTEAGQAFNVGGGTDNAVSLLEVVELIAELTGTRPEIDMDEWRTGDQRYYVSDTGKLGRATGWRPRTTVREGVAALVSWLQSARAVHAPRPLVADAVAAKAASGAGG
ncbi:MAG: GDP-mannose 4,6-dehydratase [Gemmatimonadota bacterium]|nr:GDP-mannose 4,6-dehydratase [Gemmatimonadota bacterium]